MGNRRFWDYVCPGNTPLLSHWPPCYCLYGRNFSFYQFELTFPFLFSSFTVTLYFRCADPLACTLAFLRPGALISGPLLLLLVFPSPLPNCFSFYFCVLHLFCGKNAFTGFYFSEIKSNINLFFRVAKSSINISVQFHLFVSSV